MIDLLTSILCVLRNILLAVTWAGVELVNLLALALGSFIAFVLGLLPQLPDTPSGPPAEAVGWIAWFVPAVQIVAAAAAFLVLYGVMLVARIGLRWAKAL